MKKKINLFLFVLLSLFVFNLEVYATSVSFTYRNWDTGDGTIYKIVDGSVTSFTADRIWLDGDKNTPAYCVDYGVSAGQGDATASKFSDYLKNGISDAKSEELVKELNEILYFGFGSTGRTTEKYFMATQKLVWEKIQASGFYASTYYLDNAHLFDDYSDSDLNFSTIGFYSEGSTLDISAEVKAIQDSITEFYKQPSICSNTLQVSAGEEKTFTDTNGVLSNYTVTCSDGLQCTKDGNNIKVKVLSYGSDQSVSFSKEGAGDGLTLYTISSSVQRVIAGGKVLPVSCNAQVAAANEVVISKQDATTGKELPGAELVLKDSSGSVVDKWTSKSTPHRVSNLAPGKYTLTETIAPKGYIKTSETVIV